jgi:hypothetical protein
MCCHRTDGPTLGRDTAQTDTSLLCARFVSAAPEVYCHARNIGKQSSKAPSGLPVARATGPSRILRTQRRIFRPDGWTNEHDAHGLGSRLTTARTLLPDNTCLIFGSVSRTMVPCAQPSRSLYHQGLCPTGASHYALYLVRIACCPDRCKVSIILSEPAGPP